MISKDSDQPIQSHSLARVFVNPSLDSLKAIQSTCDQRRLWSNCADAQADLSLRWSHKSYCRFCLVLAQFQIFVRSALGPLAHEWNITEKHKQLQNCNEAKQRFHWQPIARAKQKNKQTKKNKKKTKKTSRPPMGPTTDNNSETDWGKSRHSSVTRLHFLYGEERKNRGKGNHVAQSQMDVFTQKFIRD